MNKELEKYYEERFVMFSSIGWKDLIEEVQERIEAINSINGIKDMDTLRLRQGELNILEWLRSLPETSNIVYKQLKDEEDADV